VLLPNNPAQFGDFKSQFAKFLVELGNASFRDVITRTGRVLAGLREEQAMEAFLQLVSKRCYEQEEKGAASSEKHKPDTSLTDTWPGGKTDTKLGGGSVGGDGARSMLQVLFDVLVEFYGCASPATFVQNVLYELLPNSGKQLKTELKADPAHIFVLDLTSDFKNSSSQRFRIESCDAQQQFHIDCERETRSNRHFVVFCV
jgi:hypothetical protein